MITVHHLNNSRSQRILWLLEELGLEYEIKFYTRDKKTLLAPKSLRKIHPLGKAPILTDGNLTLIESGAIIDYLAETYAGAEFRPAALTPDYIRYREWLHFAEGSAMPPLMLKLIFDRMETDAPFFIRPIAKAIAKSVKSSFILPNLNGMLDYCEQHLAKHEWFAGDRFSAADIQMSLPLEASAARGGLNKTRPKCMRYLERIHARPAYQTALEKGGAYRIVS